MIPEVKPDKALRLLHLWLRLPSLEDESSKEGEGFAFEGKRQREMDFHSIPEVKPPRKSPKVDLRANNNF